jgi:hypothetical protein
VLDEVQRLRDRRSAGGEEHDGANRAGAGSAAGM